MIVAQDYVRQMSSAGHGNRPCLIDANAQAGL